MFDVTCIKICYCPHGLMLTYVHLCLQIFGPLLPFVSVKDVDEAINIINDRFVFVYRLENLFICFIRCRSLCQCMCL